MVIRLVVVRFEGRRRWLPNVMSWVTVSLTHGDGFPADEGKY